MNDHVHRWVSGPFGRARCAVCRVQDAPTYAGKHRLEDGGIPVAQLAGHGGTR